jgi:hypothetical protein
MLRIESVPVQVTQVLEKLLPDDPSPAEVTDLAQQLLMLMIKDQAVIAEAENIVKRIANLRRENESRQEQMEANKHYIFARSHKSASSMHPVYEEVRVYLRDFANFCRAEGLSERDMLRVADGQVESCKGWRLGHVAGAVRAARLDKAKPGPAMVAGPVGPAFRTPSTGMNTAAAPVYLPAQTWHPAE